MKLTESQLRRIIRNVIKESANSLNINWEVAEGQPKHLAWTEQEIYEAWSELTTALDPHWSFNDRSPEVTVCVWDPQDDPDGWIQFDADIALTIDNGGLEPYISQPWTVIWNRSHWAAYQDGTEALGDTADELVQQMVYNDRR